MTGFKIPVFTVDIFIRMFRKIRHNPGIIICGKTDMNFKMNDYNEITNKNKPGVLDTLMITLNACLQGISGHHKLSPDIKKL